MLSVIMLPVIILSVVSPTHISDSISGSQAPLSYRCVGPWFHDYIPKRTNVAYIIRQPRMSVPRTLEYHVLKVKQVGQYSLFL
jgi:hypothetical protein